MANKKKPSEKNKPVKHYLDLLYMTSSILRAKDIADLLKNNNDIKVELWDEMNVLEFELSNQSSVDFEPLDIHFKDPSDAAFVKNRNIQTIFAINLADEDLELAKPCFDQIVQQFSGFVCADSSDFNPVYAGSSVKPLI